MFLFDDVDFVQTQSLPLGELWRFLPIGYLFTIMIETPVLLVGLSRKVSFKQKLWCGVWLTACTYPIVILVLPAVFFGSSRVLYLFVAETFAPVAECVLFWQAFRGKHLFETLLPLFANGKVVALTPAEWRPGNRLVKGIGKRPTLDTAYECESLSRAYFDVHRLRA